MYTKENTLFERWIANGYTEEEFDKLVENGEDVLGIFTKRILNKIIKRLNKEREESK